MSRRKKEPDARALVRFIADHESLALTAEEFPHLGEERIRDILRAFVSELEQPRRPEPVVETPPKGARREGKRLVLHTDGASRGNPGPAGAGWVMFENEGGEVLAQGGAFLGRKTNNEAEYEAVIRGLKAARELGADEVLLRSDSELLIKQLNGEYQVRNERIAVLHGQAREAMRAFRRVEARHVRREGNSAADAMANEAIDTARTSAAFSD